ncbi:SWIM-type domain-containing protein [Citrus sinensis]|nr:SWIM-type domain-containing protein [Citrus sinensis]
MAEGHLRVKGIVKFRTLHNIHTCKGLDNNPEVNEVWIARKYRNKVLTDPRIAIDTLVNDLKKNTWGDCCSTKVYRAKRRILKSTVGGDHVESFNSLWDYANVIKQQMSRALALLKVTKHDTLANKCRFQRFTMSFLDLRDGFKEGCRPFIGLDDYHLKGPFEGIFLSTVSLDTNQKIFPIAMCALELRDEFWRAVRASSKDVFVKAMNGIRKIDEDSFQWLRKLNPKHWSVQAFAKFVKCNHTTNNMTEIIALVKYIKKRMMKAIIERRQTCLKWPSDVPAFINKKMNNMLKVSRNYHVIPTSDALYEVEIGQEFYIVNLDEHTCSCGLWQISGLPCKRVMPCIAHIRATYEKCYAGIIHLLPDKSKWAHVETDEILPPIADEPPAHRKRFAVCCSYCRGIGHNIKGCLVDPANAHKKTRRILKHRKNLAVASSSGASFTRVNTVGNSTPSGSAAQPSPNTCTPTPKQLTREGGKSSGITPQSGPIQTKRDLKSKAIA